MQKTIFITGGTGFLGKALAKKLTNNYRVIIGGRNNTQNLWAQTETGCEFTPIDVSNINSVKDAFYNYKPNIIIHAAATKFVDFSEKFPNEAIDINVTGSQNVARVGIEIGAETIVGISTDKAAPPLHNTYSITKSLMERLYSSLNGKYTTKFVCTRFGNIAWSNGSVFPIWKKMNETGLIQSTGPHMKRYIFTIDEAVDLVITSIKNIDLIHGGVLTQNMKAVLIQDVLDVWSKKYGVDWVKIEERPGDSLNESLIGEIELKHTKEIHLDNKLFYLIDFNKKFENHLEHMISTENSELMNDEDIRKLIDYEN